MLVPNAQANLAKIPDGLTDEQVVLLSDIASTGFSGAESGGVKIGRRGRGVRAGADRPVRHGRGAAGGRRARHRRRQRSASGWRSRAGWAPTSCSTIARAMSSPR